MPGKTRGLAQWKSVFLTSFNEAPAKCRGKPIARQRDRIGLQGASMRPQRNAGENGFHPRQPLPRIVHASMRPQRNAGENTRALERPASGFGPLQ